MPIDLRGEVMPNLGAAERKTLRYLADEVLARVDTLFDGAAPPDARPVLCLRRTCGDLPILGAEPHRPEMIIGLTIEDCYPAQFFLQFAHEVGHIMTGPLRGHWVAETLAVALSHEILEWASIRDDWNPGIAKARQGFGEYLQDCIEDQLSSLPAELRAAVRGKDVPTLTSFLRGNKERVVAEYVNRSFNTVGAVALRASGVHWPCLVGVAHNTDPPVEENPSPLTYGFLITRCTPAQVNALRPLGI